MWMLLHSSCCTTITANEQCQPLLNSQPEWQAVMLAALAHQACLVRLALPAPSAQLARHLPTLWMSMGDVAAQLLDCAWVPAAVAAACRHDRTSILTLLECLLTACAHHESPSSAGGAPASMPAGLEEARAEAQHKLRRAAVRVTQAINAYGESPVSSCGSEDACGSTSSGSGCGGDSGRGGSPSHGSASGGSDGGGLDLTILEQLALVVVEQLPSVVATTRRLTAGLPPSTDVSSTLESLAAGVQPSGSGSGGQSATAAGQPSPAEQLARLSAAKAAVLALYEAHTQGHLLEGLVELALIAPPIGPAQLPAYAAAALALVQLLPLVPRLQQEEGFAEDLCGTATDLAKHLLRKVQECMDSPGSPAVSPAVLAQLWHAHQWAARLVHASGDPAQRSMLPVLSDSQELLGLLLVCYDTAWNALEGVEWATLHAPSGAGGGLDAALHAIPAHCDAISSTWERLSASDTGSTSSRCWSTPSFLAVPTRDAGAWKP